MGESKEWFEFIMAKAKSKIGKIVLWCVVGLAALALLLKGCKGCTQKQEDAFAKWECEQKLDSISAAMAHKDSIIVALHTDNAALERQLEDVKEEIGRLNEDKRQLEDLNRNLTKLASQKDKLLYKDK